jgi:methylthioribose-1-phosphate isomerase
MPARVLPGPRTLEWIGGANGFLRLIDQTRLPTELLYVDCHSVHDVWESIKTLRVRGAPAIGCAAAYGVLLGVQRSPRKPGSVDEACDYLATSRPTAVNLFWALERMRAAAHKKRGPAPAATALLKRLWSEARKIEVEDQAMCRAIGRHGTRLLPNDAGVLTHCNAGSLATAGDGTALAVLYAAKRMRKRLRVYVDETRPLLQGARLTAWELAQRGIDVTLITDNMAAQVMREGKINLVIVGADRIAGNGDTANKIGTYGVAVLAMAHDVPFYVAAPSSTFDLKLPDGSAIPIEQRDPREVTAGFGKTTAPDGIHVYNPAFDVTPARLIAGLITEKGVIRPVTERNIRKAIKRRRAHFS